MLLCGFNIKSYQQLARLKQLPEVDCFELDTESLKSGLTLDKPHILRIDDIFLGASCVSLQEQFRSFNLMLNKLRPEKIVSALAWVPGAPRRRGAPSSQIFLGPDTLKAIYERIDVVEDTLSMNICLENIASPFGWSDQGMNEFDLAAEISSQTSSQLALDLNAAYLSSIHGDFDLDSQLRKLSPQSVSHFSLSLPMNSSDLPQLGGRFRNATQELWGLVATASKILSRDEAKRLIFRTPKDFNPIEEAQLVHWARVLGTVSGTTQARI